VFKSAESARYQLDWFLIAAVTKLNRRVLLAKAHCSQRSSRAPLVTEHLLTADLGLALIYQIFWLL